MSRSKLEEDVLASTISGWFQNFGGTSALDVARALSLDHALVMHTFEELVFKGDGTINRNVALFVASLDLANIGAGLKYEEVVTHIFFPSSVALGEAFYSSDLPRQDLPEYTRRLHLGAHQIALVFFDEEVLARYLDHPELYEINDSLAGGSISTLSSAPDDRHLYVRYGKCPLQSGNIAVTAIFKDLSNMGKPEQRHWHSFELDTPDADKSDRHFQKFLARTYDGEFVDFEDPISKITDMIIAINRSVTPRILFKNHKNVHLRFPVEQTYKSYCDAASELYKLMGPDNISQSTLKDLLKESYGLTPTAFEHDSGRPLSSLQLLELLEKKLDCAALFSGPVRALSELRKAADHKVLEPDSTTKSYSRDFANICTELAGALAQLANLLKDPR